MRELNILTLGTYKIEYRTPTRASVQGVLIKFHLLYYISASTILILFLLLILYVFVSHKLGPLGEGQYLTTCFV